MDDLFSAPLSSEPLAARMRPRTLDEFVGQDHIVGAGRLLRRAIDSDQLSSLIFYGPPGVGKTTLARVIAGNTQSRFVSLNAVLTGVSDIRREIAESRDARALQNRRTILFVDEVHRWNKSQQDALLPWVENGTVILIGATTENPYFEVNKALVSRSRVFQLVGLDSSHLKAIAQQALEDELRGYGRWKVEIEPGALDHLVKVSSGDARSLLNALQLAVETTPEHFPPPDGAPIRITLLTAEESIQQKVVLYDKEGDYHYDTISAFIKSLRGSDPDAALYWMARMVLAGEDPKYIFRRMLISACEDVGQASPEALGVVQSCAAAFDRVGLPEGQFFLAHACIYLATAQKSNSALGFFDALQAVKDEADREVPTHLRDDNRDKHAFGHGEGYKYPHAWRGHWIAQQYLPAGLAGQIFYRPGELGHEGELKETIITRREAQVASILENNNAEEHLTYSPGDDERERWVRRTESSREPLAVRVRDALLSLWKPRRHHRVLITRDSEGVLTWEAHRRVPEGGVTTLCAQSPVFDALKWLAGGLPAAERPSILSGGLDNLISSLDGELYDAVMARNWLNTLSADSQGAQLGVALSLSAPGALLLLAEPRPGWGTTLSDLPQVSVISGKAMFQKAEKEIFTEMAEAKHPDALKEAVSAAGWKEAALEFRNVEERRVLSEALLKSWLYSNRPGSYSQLLSGKLGAETWEKTAKELKSVLTGEAVRWTTSLVLLTARAPT